jgi:hypothetical protein
MRTLTLSLAMLIAVAAVVVAGPGKPSFAPEIFADGVAWGTTATTELPAPNDHNMQSFDKLFVITNSNNAMPQLPVGEAAPRNKMYNGGRWYTHHVVWTPAGFAAHGTVPILKSYDEVMLHHGMGHLTITPGTFTGGPPPFFSCPLLPVK